ncbi:hypothetical protein [Patulibacter defluvii]|uniref:hypothetical protein n=1 Tax=Patulibacter defluvii TaxID=3095358 RepID=UPI002A74CA72|nr:hypothetical protein [Patulibacter sp. DM4]
MPFPAFRPVLAAATLLAAPRAEIQGQPVGRFRPGPFDGAAAAYEDRVDDYVTSEPALDYAAGSILLLAAVGPRS